MIAKKLALSLALAATVALCIAGCSSSVPADSESTEVDPVVLPTQESVVLESGWCSVLSSAFDPSYYQYSVVVQNTNESDLCDATLVVAGKNDAGDTVFSQEEAIPLIAAGDCCLLGGSAGDGTAALSLEFSVSGGTLAKAPAYEASNAYVVEDVLENNGGPEGVSYTGVVRAGNAAPEGFSKAKVSVLLRDQSGALTAGYSTVIDMGAIDEAVPFKIQAPGMPQHSSYEASVIPWR